MRVPPADFLRIQLLTDQMRVAFWQHGITAVTVACFRRTVGDRATVSANGIPMVSIVSIECRDACGTICPIALRDLGFSLDDGALVRQKSVEQ